LISSPQDGQIITTAMILVSWHLSRQGSWDSERFVVVSLSAHLNARNPRKTTGFAKPR
jgi:hypothetical protein